MSTSSNLTWAQRNVDGVIVFFLTVHLLQYFRSVQLSLFYQCIGLLMFSFWLLTSIGMQDLILNVLPPFFLPFVDVKYLPNHAGRV